MRRRLAAREVRRRVDIVGPFTGPALRPPGCGYAVGGAGALRYAAQVRGQMQARRAVVAAQPPGRAKCMAWPARASKCTPKWKARRRPGNAAMRVIHVGFFLPPGVNRRFRPALFGAAPPWRTSAARWKPTMRPARRRLPKPATPRRVRPRMARNVRGACGL